MASMDRQQEFVLRTLEERDIRFVRLWFTDVSGYLKAVAVAPAEIEAAFAEGIGFDGSAIEGFARVYESDMLAKPDPGKFKVMPSAKGQPSECSASNCSQFHSSAVNNRVPNASACSALASSLVNPPRHPTSTAIPRPYVRRDHEVHVATRRARPARRHCSFMIVGKGTVCLSP